ASSAAQPSRGFARSIAADSADRKTRRKRRTAARTAPGGAPSRSSLRERQRPREAGPFCNADARSGHRRSQARAFVVVVGPCPGVPRSGSHAGEPLRELPSAEPLPPTSDDASSHCWATTRLYGLRGVAARLSLSALSGRTTAELRLLGT